MTSGAPARILVVDDDEDTRDLVTFALQAEQYAVTVVADGPSALAALRAGAFDLVITDYEMPGQTGADMLKQAGRERILGEASTLVVTAHPDPSGVPDATPLLRKPIDLERLLAQVRAILGSTGVAPAAVKAAAKKAAAKKRPAKQVAEDPTLVDLVLYVSKRSPASLKARHRMDEVLAEFDRSRIRYQTCDLQQHAASAEQDRVVFTPTLVKRAPAPRSWILGDLSEADIVRDLLTMCGVPTRDPEGAS